MIMDFHDAIVLNGVILAYLRLLSNIIWTEKWREPTKSRKPVEIRSFKIAKSACCGITLVS
jgi:hypothetical protein